MAAAAAGASSMWRRGRRWNGAAAPAWRPIRSRKAAVAALTVALAEEVAKDGILVNAVAPSIMDTPANRKAMPKADFDAWPKVEEVAATILFLASPDNRVTRGAIVPVYGKILAVVPAKAGTTKSASRDTGTSSSGGRNRRCTALEATTVRRFRIGLVVLLDVVEIVEIIHHQPVRLRDAPCRRCRPAN